MKPSVALERNRGKQCGLLRAQFQVPAEPTLRAAHISRFVLDEVLPLKNRYPLAATHIAISVHSSNSPIVPIKRGAQ